MNPRGRTITILAAVLLIGAVGVAAFQFETQRQPRPPVIGVVHETEIRIAPDISARLTSIGVKVGQEIRKGETLAMLSSPEVAASLEEAKANLESSRANLANVIAGVRQEQRDAAAQNVAIADSNLTLATQQFARVSALAAKNYASRQQYDEDAAALSKAQASLVLANAALEQSKAGPTKEELAVAQSQVALGLATVADLEAQLAKTTLTSPVDGVARLMVAEPGEAIAPGQPVLTLGVGRDRWFTFTIREDRLQGLTMGSKIALRTAAGDRFEAKVTELRPLGEFAVWRAARAVGDHDINSFLLRADPIGPTPKLEPGMTVWIDEGPVALAEGGRSEPDRPRYGRAKSRNPVVSPTTVICPLQGATSSSWTTSPGCNRLVSPSVVVIENCPLTTVSN
jgi:HlyD family secretion protein